MQTLTEGSIFKVLMKLSLPIMASAFLATAYSITDLAWIGLLGSGAISGLGITGIWWALSITSICKGIAFFSALRRITK